MPIQINFIKTMTFLPSIEFKSITNKRLLVLLVSACVILVMLAIFQDFLQSRRRDYAFYFSESLLFNALWIFFPPILLLLKHCLDKYRAINVAHTLVAALLALLLHTITVPFWIWSISEVFRSESYSIFKAFSYTVSNDLLKMILIYGGFVFSYRHYQARLHSEAKGKKSPALNCIIVKSDTKTERILFDEILMIQAATPYVSIEVKRKHHLQLASLKSIISKLDERFVRVHKSYVINIDKVVSYDSRMNGDYDLKLETGVTIRLSRNYAKRFKLLFNKRPQLNK